MKLFLYAKMNCLKSNCFFTLKQYLRKTELFEMELFWYLTVCKQNLYLYYTESAELELFD